MVAAYWPDVVLEERLAELEEVYFEGGDHQTLVKVGAGQFRRLMSGARHGRFGTHD
jgi:Ala-tRNA(Pro) deacylase